MTAPCACGHGRDRHVRNRGTCGTCYHESCHGPKGSYCARWRRPSPEAFDAAAREAELRAGRTCGCPEHRLGW